MANPDKTGSHRDTLRVDDALLSDFENGLNPAFPEKSRIVPTILGYGEISTAFCIEQMPDIALKRMPPFADIESAGNYGRIVETYCRRLREDCGVRVVPHSTCTVKNRFGEYIVYMAQPRLNTDALGNTRLKRQSAGHMTAMVSAAAARILAVGGKNRNDAAVSLGIDGQLSNWHFAAENPPFEEPRFFDITTPMLRINGVELLDAEIFLKSTPAPLVWLVRWQFLREVLDRYHDTRQVLIDLAANFYKEGRAEMIDNAIAVINAEVARHPLDPPVAPLTRMEVDRYYKNDAFIWTLFLKLRRADRFIQTRLLRRRYNFILPGKIER